MTDHPRISASALERLAVCPVSIAMPQTVEGSEASARGSRLHLALEALAKGWHRSMAATLVATDEEKELVAKVDWQAAAGDLVPETRMAEVPYLVTFCEEGPGLERVERLSEKHGRRQYPFTRRFQVAGTVDVVGWTSWDGRLVVVDWKTGGDVVSAGENAQMRFAAVAAAMAEHAGAVEVETRVAYVGMDGRVRVDRHTLDPYEVRDAAEELETTCRMVTRAFEARHLPISSVQLRPSPACRYCPGLRSCPAMVGAARHLLAEAPPTQEVLLAKLQTMTPEEVAMAWQRKDLLAGWLKRLDEAFAMMASTGPVPLADGYELRVETSTRRTLPLADVCDLARRKGATDAEIEALRVTSTSESARVCRAPGAPRGRRKPQVIDVPDDG